MRNKYLSKGAPYVRNYGWVLHGWTGADVPCLSWHPRESLFVGKDGRTRRVWGLENREEAQKICLAMRVNFIDATIPE